ncbi:alpha-amylase family glycosyl hydrolase [Croceicoccus sp. BE223]|uniref:alpha-amylase family glycosyl hydrolase n=1 Tax=Croceicoccus sp. BE223 TaxID=2817716 RepID=UPI002861FF90|nr:alpha-amylase family glycosyl hydrolase [Croceicoccus sp. BE223]MDR7103314.1 alpha-glucosidase [Croceicoccus sp. BE223]
MTMSENNPNRPWWRGATIYQIYPRSFMDSNGDGIGDLPGITSRLDYVASLGVDAIWVSPFFLSPMKDFGYDVADFRAVDPIFGALDDFDAMVARAHALGLRVLIDQVMSHTSDQHAWFVESRSSRDNPKADWFVWADAKPDGSPPSNWQSVFGGPAWTWDARRQQYYLHNFLASQPQLNCHNREVQDAMLANLEFWLERGVDGFRLDAVNFAMHDPALTDNPPAPDTGKPRTRPFDFQLRIHNQSHPDIPAYIERIRELTDRYGERPGTIFTVAEVGGDDSEAEMRAFTADDRRFNSTYGFNFLYAERLTADLVCRALTEWPDEPGTNWPSWAFENHDAPRALSRWADDEHREAFAAMKMALLACMRGNPILYNGEELGLTQVDIPFDQLQDPEAIANWPLTLSRDGVRTPLPWTAEGGFTSGTPWLPYGEENLARSVAAQDAANASLLHHTRAMLALRNAHPALHHGSVDWCRAEGALLSFGRSADGESVECHFNLSVAPVALSGLDGDAEILCALNGANPSEIPPYGALIVRP